MAIDSRDKRASCLGIGLAALRVYPNPDGDTLIFFDREQLVYLYRLLESGGIVIGLVAADNSVFQFTMSGGIVGLVAADNSVFQFTMSGGIVGLVAADNSVFQFTMSGGIVA